MPLPRTHATPRLPLIRRLAQALPVAGVLALVAMVPVEGQTRLILQAGLYAPLSDLSPGFAEAVEIGRQESTLALGAALDIRGESSLGFRLGGLYATASDVPVRGVGCPDCDARNTVLALTGAAVVRPTPMLGILRPYFVGGAGGKWYNFSIPGDRDELDDLLDGGTQLTFQVGAGVEFDFRLIRLNAELSDYLSSYEVSGSSERQNDMVFSLGLVLGGRGTR